MRERNRHMYSSMIRGYLKSTEPIKAISIYRRMIRSGISPNEFTLPFVLKACALRLAYLEGVLIQVQILKLGFGSYACVQNSRFYNECGSVQCARKVFDEITDRTSVSWNSMICGYSKMGLVKEDFVLFEEMRELGVEPDGFTFVSLLCVCSKCCEIVLGRSVHLYIEVNGIHTDIFVHNALLDMYAKIGDLRTVQTIFNRMADKNVVSWTSMIDAYAKSGLLEAAKNIFDQTPEKNVFSWNAMIQSYVQEGCFGEALDLFWKMCNSSVAPDIYTLLTILQACSQLGDLVMGKKLHDYIHRKNMLSSVTICNALMDMYAKCGPLETAVAIFDKMPDKNVVSWNVIIGALAVHGIGYKAVELFEQMINVKIQPDEITFVGLLSACCHSGLLDLGKHYFDIMTATYGIERKLEYYACMTDLLGRVGLLREAVKLVKELPMKADIVIWGALLGACRIHGNVDIGKQILKQVLGLESCSGGIFVLISNLFSEAGKFEDVKNIRKLMEIHGVRKGNAISSIDFNSQRSQT